MKGGNTFWIIWGGVLVLWLVLRYFAKQRMHPVPGMETECWLRRPERSQPTRPTCGTAA